MAIAGTTPGLLAAAGLGGTAPEGVVFLALVGVVVAAVLGGSPDAEAPDEVPPSPVTSFPSGAHAAVDAELRGLAKGLSHDLSGPLRSIGSALEMVEEDLQAGLTKEAGDTLRVVRRQTHQLVRTADSLVAYCRAAWRPCPRERVSLSAEVAVVLVDLDWQQAPQLALDLPNTPVILEGAALRDVLHVVLDNALRHHPHPESATVRIVGRIEAVSGAPRWLSLQVHDNGCGIPAKMHLAVFDMFRRSATQAEGAGLGLSLAHTLTTRFGGHIGVRGSPLGGTSVDIRWPLSSSLSPPPSSPEVVG